MRFISVFTHNSANPRPTEAQMAAMGNLIVEGMTAEWLIECEGVDPSTVGTRARKATDGNVTLTDGPFTEPKDVLGGYALFNVASKEEAVAYTLRFLDHVVQGTWETYRLFEMPAEQ